LKTLPIDIKKEIYEFIRRKSLSEMILKTEYITSWDGSFIFGDLVELKTPPNHKTYIHIYNKINSLDMEIKQKIPLKIKDDGKTISLLIDCKDSCFDDKRAEKFRNILKLSRATELNPIRGKFTLRLYEVIDEDIMQLFGYRFPNDRPSWFRVIFYFYWKKI
jgi:hypothetical protein